MKLNLMLSWKYLIKVSAYTKVYLLRVPPVANQFLFISQLKSKKFEFLKISKNLKVIQILDKTGRHDFFCSEKVFK